MNMRGRVHRGFLIAAMALVPTLASAQPPPDGSAAPQPVPVVEQPPPAQPPPAAPPPGYVLVAPAPVGYAPPPPPPEPLGGHQGLLVGFSLGAGAIVPTSCEGCDALGGFAFDFSIGGFLNERFALMYDAFGVIRPEDGVVVANATNTLAAQYWALDRLWLKAGLGLSQIRVATGFGDAVEFGFGTTFAIGLDLIQSGHFGLDIQGRFSFGTFDGGSLANTAAMIGFHWY